MNYFTILGKSKSELHNSISVYMYLTDGNGRDTFWNINFFLSKDASCLFTFEKLIIMESRFLKIKNNEKDKNL